MFIILLYFLLYSISVANCKIEIRDANVATISREDIGMIFYVTVENSNSCPYEVKLNMVECTEVFSVSDKDNRFMYLIGGHMGVIKPHCFKNLTIIYPNMYLHNRRGYCIISVKFKDNLDEIVQRKANISFDTYITKKEIVPIMRGYVNRGVIMDCESNDLDPLNRCQPVDCPMKYLGTRNYYSKNDKRCVRIPKCIMDPKKEMPNIIYSPHNNKCRDMEKTVTKTELQTIDSGLFKTVGVAAYYDQVNVNCHFGKFSTATGNCDCYPGWASAPTDKIEAPAASLLTYHMCNMESTDWYDTDSRRLKMISLVVGIIAVIIAMIVILCAFVVQMCVNCIKSFEGYTDDRPKKTCPGRSKKRHRQKEKRSRRSSNTGSGSSSDRSHRSHRSQRSQSQYSDSEPTHKKH